MNICLRNKKFWYEMGMVVLTCFITFQANASLYEDEMGVSETFSVFDMKQEQEYIKSNYKFVLELLKRKKVIEAQETVAAYIKQFPNLAIYYNLKAIVDIFNQDISSAEESFNKAILLDNSNVQAYTGLSKIAFEAKSYSKAKQYADKAISRNPYEINAYGILANIALQQEGVDSAEKVLLDANTAVKGDLKAELKVLKRLKKLYKEKKQQEKLVLLAKGLVERNSAELNALSFLADAQLSNQEFLDAENTLRQIIFQYPKDAKHHFLLARVLAEIEGKEEVVLTLLDQAASNLDFSAYILAYKTKFLIKHKKYQQALLVVEKIDRSYPMLTVGMILKGDLYFSKKEYVQAMGAYKEVYQIRPSVNVLDAILKILMIQNKHKEGVFLLKDELVKSNGATQIKLRLAEFYQGMGEYDSAAKNYKELLAKQKDNVVLLNNLAWVYSQQENPEALSLAEKAYKKLPDSAVIADTYGYILFKSGRTSEAVEILARAVQMAPKLANIKLHLAKVYISNGEGLKAKELLLQIIESNGEEKVEAIRLMEQL